MNMLQEYYLNKLYPLQDQVLQLIQTVNQKFYLTGGTALGRYYLKHRFSDDLDFFVNNDANFKLQAQKIVDKIKINFITEIAITDENFLRLFIVSNDVTLKVEFINDVAYSYGEKLVTDLFNKTDNWQNILSNKISALNRDEAKDIVDIIFLAINFSFNWKDIIAQAKEKDMWVDELESSKLINEFDINRVEKVNWVQRPNFDELFILKQQISRDILAGTNNSLYKNN